MTPVAYSLSWRIGRSAQEGEVIEPPMVDEILEKIARVEVGVRPLPNHSQISFPHLRARGRAGPAARTTSRRI
jgi:hypothetical protein